MSARERRLTETFSALASITWRLELSLRKDADRFPVTPQTAASKEPDLVTSLDAFLQRFTQTLDHLLRKLFPRLEAAISGSDELLPIGTLLENLHRAGVIETVQVWRELIEVRNRLTHEYALDPVGRAEALNEAWTRTPLLLAQVSRARGYAERHGLLGEFGP